MLGVLEHRRSAGNCRARIFQFGRLVGRTALLAVVAVLIFGAALRARAFDEAVGEEHAFLGVEILGHRARRYVPRIVQARVDQLGELTVLIRMRRIEVVEVDQKVGEIGTVLGLHVGDQLLRRDAFLFGAEHDRRAVRVIGADVHTLVAAQLLEAHPHVGLDVLEHVAEVDRAVGVGQGAGDEDLAGFGHGLLQSQLLGESSAL